jgi:methionine-rich copper-binding protein CopC
MVSMNLRRLAIVLLGGLIALLFASGQAWAHDDIASSTPPSGSTIDDPITEVTIDFGEEVADVEMALIAPNDDIVEPSETELVTPTSARITFAELDQEGVYIVRYLAPVVRDGHTLAGAIQFTYGSAGGSNLFPILLFCGVAVIGLSIGAFFSWRRYRQLSGSEIDENLADIGV